MSRTLINQTKENIGSEVVLKGWVENHRAMGKLIFINLRDRSGKVQCVGSKENFEAEVWAVIKGLTLESVVSITGKVKERPNAQESEDEFGSLEIEISSVELLNKAAPLPIPVIGDGKDINEESRLKYRYLDLRRDRMGNILKTRSKFIRALREALYNQEFVEVETPILTASTMEGARDFVVPSRLHPGKFYALPQSPQQYKQLLMTAGVENYFQVAKCIRDEDLRADRGFEFTQLDLETSFKTQEDVMNLVEEVVKSAVKEVGGKLKDEAFPRFTYEEAMEKYGADKFDIRSEEEKQEVVLAFAWVHRFPFFKKVDTEDVAEVRDGKSGWTFTHNPFSMPLEEHLEWHLNGEHTGEIITQQYDLVCNGYEAGGGSIRAHRPDILRATYKTMGYSEEEIERSVGHMLKAFEVGTPPHGGIALGIDRLVMILSGEESLKETIAFPMTYNGRTAVMEGPGPISEEQRTELHLDMAKAKDGDEIAKQIKSLLDAENIDYKYEEHQPTPTSQDAANFRGKDLSEGVKALILVGKKSGKNFMVTIPGDKKLDTKALKDEIGEEVTFEKPEVILEKFGVRVGGVPPFGIIFDIPTYFDESILNSDEVAFSAGKDSISIYLSSKDLEKALKGKLGLWSK
ncbi:aspartate--tRNA ligase [Candidatus Dojkabacteria bacterium]|uniref:Aspartate--tRNA ligase n=1 Tax=Candidatus Dojkabacteria bacterium TaxID=2099670 RepID=A0A955RM02_9BACT|nr:aspartate--tRNA ligase [Candidatus Dojkabacteria bacterium]